jgi:hypothetical protein
MKTSHVVLLSLGVAGLAVGAFWFFKPKAAVPIAAPAIPKPSPASGVTLAQVGQTVSGLVSFGENLFNNIGF